MGLLEQERREQADFLNSNLPSGSGRNPNLHLWVSANLFSNFFFFIFKNFQMFLFNKNGFDLLHTKKSLLKTYILGIFY